jgi:2'-5' RNA ligase
VWAVEINLDPESEDRVAAIWDSMDAAGVESLGSVPGTEYRPHVSLAVFEKGDRDRLSAVLTPVLRPLLGAPLSLASLGFFVNPQAVAFLGVTATQRLLDVHRQVHSALGGVAEGSWSLYEPGTFVPHCTLAMGYKDLTPIMESVTDELPIHAVAHEAHIIDTFSGRSQASL